MNKISSKDAAALLKQAATGIRSVVKENSELREKLANHETTERVEKLARDMEAKGLSPELAFEEKVAALREAENLDVTEEAVKLATPQVGVELGLPSEDVPGASVNALETYILTGEDPRGL